MSRRYTKKHPDIVRYNFTLTLRYGVRSAEAESILVRLAHKFGARLTRVEYEETGDHMMRLRSRTMVKL